MRAGELCNRDVVTAEPGMSMQQAAELMREHHVGCLVVVRGSAGQVEPAGIVTDRDIVIEVIAKGIALDDVTVGDIMSFALLKVGEDDSVFECAQRMRSRGVRRVPVITHSGTLAGILALDDILSLLGEELSLLCRITERETEQEAKKRPPPGANT